MDRVGDSRPIRVFLVDDHAVVRRGMRAFFDMFDDIEILGEAADGRAALDELAVLAARQNLPDVVLMDLLMPRLDGVAATTAIKGLYPSVEVVALTSFSEAERVHLALAAGAAGYLLKDAEPTRWSQRSGRRAAARYTSIPSWPAS
jgi:DNA-binding NarL/FixJ family response regulator